jgi:hypothetical protein
VAAKAEIAWARHKRRQYTGSLILEGGIRDEAHFAEPDTGAWRSFRSMSTNPSQYWHFVAD